MVADASLEDYALVAQGLWDWSQQTPAGRESLQLKVAQLVRIAWQRYYSGGRWRNSDKPLIPMLEGSLAMQDSPLPSATAAISRISGEHPALREDKAVQKQLQQHSAGRECPAGRFNFLVCKLRGVARWRNQR